MSIRIYIFLIILFLPAFGLAQVQPDNPEPPVVDYVSVDTATGGVYLTWGPSPTDSIVFFTIFEIFMDNGIPTGTFLGTIGADTLEYLWITQEANKRAVSMAVYANRSGDHSRFSDVHTTMFLTTQYDSCEKEMKLSWTPYIGWHSLDYVKHKLFVSIDNGSYNKIAETDDTVYHFVHNNIEDNRRYCYFVKAIRNDGVGSFSNVACRMIRHPLHPQWIDAEQSSAEGEDQVSMEFHIEESGEVSSFQLFRATGPGKPFIEHEIFTDVTGPALSYNDQVVSTEKQYLYKLYSLDVCFNPVVSSNITGNIVLFAHSVSLQAFLSWYPYVDYEVGVKSYQIYRITNMGEPELINVIDAPDTAYTDNLDFVSGSDIEDEICYYVVAEENDNYNRGDKGFSQSNTKCISVTPKILMPNAFTPNGDGRNDIIKPVLTFIPEKYIYQVFDRWGSRIFETTDPEEGWDGSVRGMDKASEGVYIYYILLTTTKGIEVEQRGEITLFYP